MNFPRRYLSALGLLVCIVCFQNCSAPFQFTSTETASSSPPKSVVLTSQNNGQGYDGKIVVFHHYNDEKKYWCQKQEVPESLIYKDTANMWFIQRALQEPCSFTTPEGIEGVLLSADQQSLSYKDKTYELPKDYQVNPLADPNGADKNIYDGLCLDSNNQCSLRAALEQASILLWIKNTRIQVPANTYKLTAPIKASLSWIPSNYRIHLEGESPLTTLIDGQNLTSHLLVTGEHGTLDISNISFINGNSSAGSQGAAISTQNFFGKLNISNCSFNANKGNPDVSSVLYGGEINVKNSTFQNNPTNAASILVFGTKLTVENTSIFNNAGMGIVVSNRTSYVLIKNSSIFNNGSVGIYLYECLNCSVENTTLYQNNGGLAITTVSPNDDSGYVVKVRNSTIVNSSTPLMGNVHLSYSRPSHQATFFNTVVANTKDSNANCTGGALRDIMSQSSFYSDSSCFVKGSGNLFQPDPLLEPLTVIPGLTSILRPSPGSPLINSGDNATCLATDQILTPRTSCDIGAAEAL